MKLKRYLNKNQIITTIVSYKQDIHEYSVKEDIVIDQYDCESSLNDFLDRKNRNLTIYNISCKDKNIYIYDKNFSEDHITMRPFIVILFAENISYVHAFDSDDELNKWVDKMGLKSFFNSKDVFCPDDI